MMQLALQFSEINSAFYVTGEPVGYFSAALNQIARTYDHLGEFTWIDLSPAESMVRILFLYAHFSSSCYVLKLGKYYIFSLLLYLSGRSSAILTLLMFIQEISQGDKCQKLCGRIRCSVLLPPANEVEDNELSFPGGRKRGFIQISPTKEGPWTTVRLNYAAPAACWRLGNDVVASEVSIKDGNRYVNIRSLVSVRNNTDFTLDVCLKLKDSVSDGNMRPLEGASKPEEIGMDVNNILTDEFFETEKYDPTLEWISCMAQSELDHSDSVHSRQVRGLTWVLPHGLSSFFFFWVGDTWLKLWFCFYYLPLCD